MTNPDRASRRSRLVAPILGLVVVLVATVAVGALPLAANATQGLTGGLGAFNALPADLRISPPAQVSTIYAKRGDQDVAIANFYAQNRQNVAFDQIADTVKQAAVDTEDPRFYSEGAIDIVGTIRGALSTAFGGDVQGGSSITQQYVKNVLVERCAAMTDADAAAACYQNVTAVTAERKIREVRYAVGLEGSYSKNDILAGYLNIVGFGGNVYGVQAASMYYFNVPASALSVSQAATLVAILNNPSNLRIDQPANTVNGTANGYALTKTRRDYVLTRMNDAGDLTAAELAAAKAEPVTPTITPLQSGCAQANQVHAGFYCDYVRNVVLNDTAFGKTADDRLQTLTAGGLKIYTPLDLDLQNTAQTSLSNYIPAVRSGMNLGSANVSVEPGTGRIITMVQNKDFNDAAGAPAEQTSVNYNTDAAYGGSQGFQTGSSFKPFTLAAWLAAGHSLNERISAYQHTFRMSQFTNSCMDLGGPNFTVANDEGTASSLTALTATAESVNTAYMQMATKLDLCSILKGAEAMGVHAASKNNPLMSNPTMVLGTNYIAPLTMATAYAGIANGGSWCTPIAIDRITGPNGDDIPATKTTCTDGMDPDVAAGVAYALQRVLVSGGTASSANPRDDVPIFGKTGTTDNSLENWLVTSTTKIATATWVGNVEGEQPLRRISFKGIGGGNVKFAIAKPILAALNARYGGDEFPDPPASMLKYTSGSSYTPTPTPSETASPTPTRKSTPTSKPLPTTQPPQSPVPGDGTGGQDGGGDDGTNGGAGQGSVGPGSVGPGSVGQGRGDSPGAPRTP